MVSETKLPCPVCGGKLISNGHGGGFCPSMRHPYKLQFTKNDLTIARAHRARELAAATGPLRKLVADLLADAKCPCHAADDGNKCLGDKCRLYMGMGACRSLDVEVEAEKLLTRALLARRRS